MNFVLDCSLALAFVLADEATADTDKILDRFGQGEKACVPALWRWEVANVLLNAERRNRITQAEVTRNLSLLNSLPVLVDEAASDEAWHESLLLAQKHKLTSYDAAYLELAIRHGVALGSLDQELRAAALAESVAVIP